MPIQRSVIANFENGRRASVGVAELLVFAAVLQIPPVWLIAPMGFESSIEVLPGDAGDPYAYAFWIGGENAREDEEEEIYGTNPVPLAADLLFVLQQIEKVRSEIEQIRPIAENAAPELADIEERLAALREEFQASAAAQKQLLEKVREMSVEERSTAAVSEMFAEADSMIKRMSECSDEMSALTTRKTEIGQSRSNLEFQLKWLTDYEKDAREVIGEFRKNDWLPPQFPEHLTYLLEEPEKEVAPQVPVRRRKNAR
jgi:transcriptional regulator with XRE-family HTH domain